MAAVLTGFARYIVLQIGSSARQYISLFVTLEKD